MDQRAIQNILEKAVARLQSVYKGEVLIQQEPVSPVKFQPYHKSSGAGAVIGLIRNIIEDSKKLEEQANAAEQSSQSAYAEFVTNANDSIKALNQGIETKTKLKAAADAEKADKEAEKSDTEDRLEGLQQEASDLHQQCDFLLKNFDIRAKAITQEIEALAAAKAYLNGMTTGEPV